MIYFDNAATTRYKPKKAIRAAVKAMKKSANPGRSSHRDAIEAAIMIQQTREDLLSFVNAKHHSVAFTKNCTEALNLAILGTAKLGGHVITTAFEHNSVLRPLYMLKKEGLIALTIVEPTKSGTLDVHAIERAINEKTYLICVTGMSNVTGYAPPLSEIGEIASKHGILLSVDGAQSLGHIPTDMEKCGIDLLAGAGHKSLHGASGTGFLVFNKKIFVNPINYGGTGTESDNLRQPFYPPESLESGTLNTVGIAALKEGLLWTKDHFSSIEEKTKKLSCFLHEELGKIGRINLYSVPGSPIVTFALKEANNAEVTDRLNEEFGIGVRYGLHCAPLIHKAIGSPKGGAIRASIGFNNSKRNAEALVRAIQTIARDTEST